MLSAAASVTVNLSLGAGRRNSFGIEGMVAGVR